MSPRKQVIKASRALPSAGDGDCVEVDDTDEEVKEVMSRHCNARPDCILLLLKAHSFTTHT